MTSRQWVVLSMSIAVLACGGQVNESTASSGSDGGADTGRGTAGRSTASAGGSMGVVVGAGGAVGAAGAGVDGSGGVFLGLGGESSGYVDGPDGGTACAFSHLVCGTFDSYVEIQGDGDPLRLTYPSDAGCGTCRDGRCELYSYGTDACGRLAVFLSACAGPNGGPPCLDTASDASYYVDRIGRKWGLAGLGTTSPVGGAEPPAGVIDIQMTLEFGDPGGETHELSAHVHVCGDIRRLLLPCVT